MDILSLREEIEQLQRELQAEKALRIEVQEERDFLLAENDRLRSAHSSYSSKVLPVVTNIKNDTDVAIAQATILSSEKVAYYPSLRIPDASGGKNVISVVFLNRFGDSLNEIVVCGGADSSLTAYNLSTGVKLIAWPMSAPVLSIDAFEDRVACGMMDGSVAIIRLPDASIDNIGNSMVEHMRRHRKYVVQVVWSPDGAFLCTISHDKSVIIYSVSDFGEVLSEKTISCKTTPECAAFVPILSSPSYVADDFSSRERIDPAEPTNLVEYFAQLAEQKKCTTTVTHGNNAHEDASAFAPGSEDGEGSAGKYELVLGLRDVSFLTYVNCMSLQCRTVSLNENSWDMHVSFTPLCLSPNPNGELILIATDKDMHIILKTSTNERVQILSGHNCGIYGKPSVVWDHRGEVIYSNSDDESSIYAYSADTGKVLKILQGHDKGIVRGLAAHRSQDKLLSASYDKSVVVWTTINKINIF